MRTAILLVSVIAAAGADRPAVERLFDASLSPTQRANACFELRGNKETAVVEAMQRAMQNAELVSCAVVNLRMAGAVEALKQVLASGEPEARAAAARELGALRRPEMLEALSAAAADENPLVATNALAGLSYYEDPAVAPYLTALAKRGGMVGDMALERLLLIDRTAALVVARGLLASPQVPDQLYALRVIGAAGGAQDLPALRKIAAAPHENLAQRDRGFGLMPAINLSRAAQAAIDGIAEREK